VVHTHAFAVVGSSTIPAYSPAGLSASISAREYTVPAIMAPRQLGHEAAVRRSLQALLAQLSTSPTLVQKSDWMDSTMLQCEWVVQKNLSLCSEQTTRVRVCLLRKAAALLT
jgi:hypothetical protein